MKAKITMTLEYKLNPAYYPEGSTAREMLEMDINNYKDDPSLLLENIGDCKFSGVLIDENNNTSKRS